MTTNAKSAKQWLETTGINEPRERIEQIAHSILTKLTQLADDDPQQQGLIEALAIVEDYLENLPLITTSDSTNWDTTPLGESSVEPIPQLTKEEKQQQFQQLLKQQTFTKTNQSPESNT